MISVQTAKSGIFEPLVKVGDAVREGTPLANIVHPYDGEILETLFSPSEAKVFFMHNDPLTYANTSVVKLIWRCLQNKNGASMNRKWFPPSFTLERNLIVCVGVIFLCYNKGT